jgi:deoxyribose-phosphate aldolase
MAIDDAGDDAATDTGTSAGQLARRIASLIDLTDLRDDHAPDGIAALCERARDAGTAAVCVWPEHVARCRAILGASAGRAGDDTGAGVRIATVVNFPSGEEAVDVVVAATERALDDGADEIDVVLPWRALAAGRAQPGHDVVAAVVAASHARDAVVKVILESGELGSPDLIRRAADLAIDSGADFVKTSTGKTAHGASLEAAGVLLDAVADARRRGRDVGVKPSGGISTVEAAAAYLALADERLGADWATPATFRFGASSLLDAVLAVLDDGA